MAVMRAICIEFVMAGNVSLSRCFARLKILPLQAWTRHTIALFLADRRRTNSLQKMQRPCQKCNERSFRELRGTRKYIVPMFIIMIGPFWTASVFYAVRSVIVVHNSVSVVPRGPHRCRRMDTLPLPFLDYRPRPCCSPLLLRASKPRSPLRNSQ